MTIFLTGAADQDDPADAIDDILEAADLGLPPLPLPLPGARDAVPSPLPRATARKPRSDKGQPRGSSPLSGRQVLYFDLETIPDYSRQADFGLDPIPDAVPRATLEVCLASPIKIFDSTVIGFAAAVARLNPCDEYLDQLEAAERATPKPRAGVSDAIAKVRGQDAARLTLIEQRRKDIATSPEMNTIVAMGWGYPDGMVRSLVVGEPLPGAAIDSGETVDERYILEQWWSLAAQASKIIGFNILGFDLPTLFIRSMILDVRPTRLIDLKPWGNDCCDLMAIRFPKSSAKRLKWLATAMGIDVPAGDVDGSQVEALWRTDPVKVGEYVRSDVEISRELHRAYRGFFC